MYWSMNPTLYHDFPHKYARKLRIKYYWRSPVYTNWRGTIVINESNGSFTLTYEMTRKIDPTVTHLHMITFFNPMIGT